MSLRGLSNVIEVVVGVAVVMMVVLLFTNSPTQPPAAAPEAVAAAAGVAAKCLTTIAGVPMVVRVIHALQESACVDTILLCGPAAEMLQESPELRELVDGKRVRWMGPLGTPSASAEPRGEISCVSMPATSSRSAS